MKLSGSKLFGKVINYKYFLGDSKGNDIKALLYAALKPELSPSNIIVGLLTYFQESKSWSSVKAVPSGATAVLILFS